LTRLTVLVLNGNNVSNVSNGNMDLLVVLITDFVPMDSVAMELVRANVKFVNAIVSLLPLFKTLNTMLRLLMVNRQNTAPDHPLVVDRVVMDSAVRTAKAHSAGTMLRTTPAAPTVKSDQLEHAK